MAASETGRPCGLAQAGVRTGQDTALLLLEHDYVIAGLIVEAVTGHTIGAELNRRIFQPLHLRDTRYPTKPGLPSPYAHGYMVLGKGSGERSDDRR